MRASATRRPMPSVELVQADAAASELPAGGFDLVHERALLLNLTDPAPVVAEMVRLARPGGTVGCRSPTPPPGSATPRTPRSTA